MAQFKVPCSRVMGAKDCLANEHYQKRNDFIKYEDQTLGKEVTAFGIVPTLAPQGIRPVEHHPVRQAASMRGQIPYRSEHQPITPTHEPFIYAARILSSTIPLPPFTLLHRFGLRFHVAQTAKYPDDLLSSGYFFLLCVPRRPPFSAQAS